VLAANPGQYNPPLQSHSIFVFDSLSLAHKKIKVMANHQLLLCGFCEEIPTHHHCHFHVSRGRIHWPGQGQICGELICAPCSSSFGNEEGVFRCVVHSNHDDSDVEDSDKENTSSEVNKKTSFDDGAAIGRQPLKSSSKKKNKVLSKAIKSAEYSAKDLLILSQSYIRVSENAIEGISQKKKKFWDDVARVFKKLKTQREEYDRGLQKKEKYNKVMLQGEFLSSDDDNDNASVTVMLQMASSLQQKWSKSVLYYVTKFVSLTNRYPIKSGEGLLPIIPCFLV
jgi:hypothetical protein